MGLRTALLALPSEASAFVGAASMPRCVELCLIAGPDALVASLMVGYSVLWETAEIKLGCRWLIHGYLPLRH